MDGGREMLLAGPALAEEEDAEIGAGDAVELAEHGGHGGAPRLDAAALEDLLGDSFNRFAIEIGFAFGQAQDRRGCGEVVEPFEAVEPEVRVAQIDPGCRRDGARPSDATGASPRCLLPTCCLQPRAFSAQTGPWSAVAESLDPAGFMRKRAS
jgi:hypothetical protein